MHLEVGKKYVAKNGLIYLMKCYHCDGHIISGQSVESSITFYWMRMTARGIGEDTDIIKEYTEEEWRPFKPEEFVVLVGRQVKHKYESRGGLITWYNKTHIKLASGDWVSPNRLLDGYDLLNDCKWTACGVKLNST